MNGPTPISQKLGPSMTEHDIHLRRVRELAAEVLLLPRDNHKTIHMIGFMIGALYALERARTLGYDDSRANTEGVSFAGEFGKALESIVEQNDPPQAWLAGFFFISALFRLAALSNRIDGFVGKKRRLAPVVRDIVDLMKHDPSAHIGSTGRREGSTKIVIKYALAVEGAELIAEALADAVNTTRSSAYQSTPRDSSHFLGLLGFLGLIYVWTEHLESLGSEPPKN